MYAASQPPRGPLSLRVHGSVIAIHGGLVRVQIGDRTLVVTARRRLDWEGGEPEVSRLVVGDEVALEVDGDEGVITGVHARRSCLLRQAPRGGTPQILAANVDQALVVFAASNPEPKPGLVDRFLVACHLSDIDAVVVINKRDLGLAAIEPWLAVYEQLGLTVLRVSARSGWGLGRIRRRLAGRTTLFCGPSGVGKSSLLNAVYPGFRLKVGSLSEATGKGRHTTTTAELMPLPYGGFVVDTPGLKEFGLWKVEPRELAGAFPELAVYAGQCRYPDCSHVHEPGCPVRDAVDAGDIDARRYASYTRLLEELAE